MALSPYQMMLMGAQAAPAAPTMPAMNSGVPEDAMLRARRMMLQVAENAPTDIDPRMAAILDRRNARISEMEAQMQKAQRGTPWEALSRAGAAMASSNSPFFGQALAAGTNVGLETLRQRQMEAMRQRSGIADARDEIDMERINLEGAGRRAAAQGLKDQVALANDLTEQELRQAQARKAMADAIPDPQMRAIELRKAEMQIAEIQSKILENRAQAARAMRPDGGDGNGRPAPQGLIRAHDSALRDYEQAQQMWNANAADDLWKEGEDGRKALAQLRAAASRVNRISEQLKRATGEDPMTSVRSGTIANPAPVRAATTGNRFVYNPQTGKLESR